MLHVNVFMFSLSTTETKLIETKCAICEHTLSNSSTSCTGVAVNPSVILGAYPDPFACFQVFFSACRLFLLITLQKESAINLTNDKERDRES